MSIFERLEQPDPDRSDLTSDATSDATHTAEAAPPAAAPTHWDEFRILRELGHGGFGRVYAAYDEGLAKEIALKIVRPSDPSRIPEVMREGQMLARVRHPNVVTVHAVRRVGADVGFVMDLIDGESLADRVRRVGRLGAEEAVAIGETLCHALAAVHAAGLLHRDVKARNVMRDSAGRLVLMDFGAGREEAAPRANDLTGTPHYLAPEIYQGRPASRASDIYSIGVLLYYLVSGSYPVEGTTSTDIAGAHWAGRRRLLVDRRPDLSPDFIHVVERAIAPEPAQRYQSAGELFQALHTLAVRPQVRLPEAVRTNGHIGSPWPSRLARGAALAGASVMTLMLLGFLATRVYDKTFDVGRYSDDGLGTWLRIGLRSVVPLIAWVLIVAVASLILRTVWQVIRSAVPPVNGLAGRVEKTVSSALSRRRPIERLSLARWLLLTQAAVVLLLALKYQPLLTALVIPFNTGDPSVWQVLYYSSDEVGLVNGWQALLPIAAAAMGLAWWRLIRSSGGLVALDRPIVAAGFAIVVLLIAGAAVPFRVFYDARNLHRYEIDNERCYEVGRRGDEVRVFCPDVGPGLRIRTVPAASLGRQLDRSGVQPLSPYARVK
jgi:serine/threonine protein kinase